MMHTISAYYNFLQIHWNVHSVNKNPKYFPDPEKFDPSRFEGLGPPPYICTFLGGPDMCARKEFARVELLVFIYNEVTRFKLEKVNPNEKISYSLKPILEHCLAIHLQPYQVD